MNFLHFAAAHGLIIDRLIEGRWARCKTEDKRTKRNGSYKFMGDIAFIQNHATMDSVAVWRPEGVTERIDRSRMRALQRQHEIETEKRQAAARALAKDMIDCATFATHPYLQKKGFPKEQGFVLDGELLIPMRDCRHYKVLNGVQRISPIGEKLFLPGSKAKESVLFMGPFMATERWLVEGYATALSVKTALDELRRRAQVAACFSAGNIAAVAKWARELRTPVYVAADNDASGTGQRVAIETGLPWVMPAEIGDCNDLHQQHGIRTLVALIRGIDDG